MKCTHRHADARYQQTNREAHDTCALANYGRYFIIGQKRQIDSTHSQFSFSSNNILPATLCRHARLLSPFTQLLVMRQTNTYASHGYMHLQKSSS